MVELTKDEKTQADALSVVLSLQYFSCFHARAMAEESGFALLKRILLSPECKIGYHTLKVYIHFHFGVFLRDLLLFDFGYCVSSFLIGSLDLGYQLIYHIMHQIWKLMASSVAKLETDWPQFPTVQAVRI